MALVRKVQVIGKLSARTGGTKRKLRKILLAIVKRRIDRLNIWFSFCRFYLSRQLYKTRVLSAVRFWFIFLLRQTSGEIITRAEN
jgi:hypothetical protein